MRNSKQTRTQRPTNSNVRSDVRSVGKMSVYGCRLKSLFAWVECKLKAIIHMLTFWPFGILNFAPEEQGFERKVKTKTAKLSVEAGGIHPHFSSLFTNYSPAFEWHGDLLRSCFVSLFCTCRITFLCFSREGCSSDNPNNLLLGMSQMIRYGLSAGCA